MSLISCENVCLGYDGINVVENLTFTVNASDYLCIVGENGSGKSTLMRAILGLKSVSSGKISYGDGLLKSHIGYLPQQTDVQKDFPASVEEVVISGCLNKCGLSPFYTQSQRETAKKNMELLNIYSLKKRCFRELSGGQRQRVLLARALCASSRLILLDEPVSGLDPQVTGEMYSIISDLNKSGIAVITVSHDIAAAVKYASHVLHVAHSPKFFGTTEEYIKSDVGSSFICGGSRK